MQKKTTVKYIIWFMWENFYAQNIAETPDKHFFKCM